MAESPGVDRLRSMSAQASAGLEALAQELTRIVEDIRVKRSVPPPVTSVDFIRGVIDELRSKVNDAGTALGLPTLAPGTGMIEIEDAISAIEEAERTRTQRLRRRSSALEVLARVLRLRSTEPRSVPGLDEVKARALQLRESIDHDANGEVVTQLCEGTHVLAAFLDLVAAYRNSRADDGEQIDTLESRVEAELGRRARRSAHDAIEDAPPVPPSPSPAPSHEVRQGHLAEVPVSPPDTPSADVKAATTISDPTPPTLPSQPPYKALETTPSTSSDPAPPRNTVDHPPASAGGAPAVGTTGIPPRASTPQAMERAGVVQGSSTSSEPSHPSSATDGGRQHAQEPRRHAVPIGLRGKGEPYRKDKPPSRPPVGSAPHSTHRSVAKSKPSPTTPPASSPETALPAKPETAATPLVPSVSETSVGAADRPPTSSTPQTARAPLSAPSGSSEPARSSDINELSADRLDEAGSLESADPDAEVIRQGLACAPSQLAKAIDALPKASQRRHPITLSVLAEACVKQLPLDEVAIVSALADAGAEVPCSLPILLTVEMLALAAAGTALEPLHATAAFSALADEEIDPVVPLALTAAVAHVQGGELIPWLESWRGHSPSRWPKLTALLDEILTGVLQKRRPVPLATLDANSPLESAQEAFNRDIQPELAAIREVFKPAKMDRRNDFLQSAWGGVLEQLESPIQALFDGLALPTWSARHKSIQGPCRELLKATSDKTGESVVVDAEKRARRALASKATPYHSVIHQERRRWKDRIVRLSKIVGRAVKAVDQLASLEAEQSEVDREFDARLRPLEHAVAASGEVERLRSEEPIFNRFVSLGLRVLAPLRKWTWVASEAEGDSPDSKGASLPSAVRWAWSEQAVKRLRPTTLRLARVSHDAHDLPLCDVLDDLVHAVADRLSRPKPDGDVPTQLLEAGALGAAERWFGIQRPELATRFEERRGRLEESVDRLHQLGSEVLSAEEHVRLRDYARRAQDARARSDFGRMIELLEERERIVRAAETKYGASLETRLHRLPMPAEQARQETLKALTARVERAIANRSYLVAHRFLTTAERVCAGTHTAADLDLARFEEDVEIPRWPTKTVDGPLGHEAERLKKWVNVTAEARSGFDRLVDQLANQLGVPREGNTVTKGAFYAAELALPPPWSVGDVWPGTVLLVWAPEKEGAEQAHESRIREVWPGEDRQRCAILLKRSVGKFDPVAALRLDSTADDLNWVTLPLDQLGALDGMERGRARMLLQAWLLRSLPIAVSNPFSCEGPVEGLRFAGRESELDRLASPRPPFAVFGSRKCGKTSLYHEFNRRVRGTNTLVAYVNVNNCANPPERALSKIAEALAGHPDAPADARQVWLSPQALTLNTGLDKPDLTEHAETFVRLTRDFLKRLGARRRLIVWLDEADNFLRQDISRRKHGAPHQVGPVTWMFRDELLQVAEFRDRFHVVFAGYTDVHRIAGRMDARTAMFNFAPGGTMQLGVLPLGDAQSLVRSKLGWLGATIADEPLEQLLRYAGLHPMLIQSLCKTIVETRKESAWKRRPVSVDSGDVRHAAKLPSYEWQVTGLLKSNFCVDPRLSAVYQAALLLWSQEKGASEGDSARGFTETEVRERLWEAARIGAVPDTGFTSHFSAGVVEVLLDELCALGLLERLDVSGAPAFHIGQPLLAMLWSKGKPSEVELGLIEELSAVVSNTSTETTAPTARAYPVPLESSDEVVLAGSPHRLVLIVSSPGSGSSAVCRQIVAVAGRSKIADVRATGELCRELSRRLTGVEIALREPSEWVRAVSERLATQSGQPRPVVVVEQVDPLCRDATFLRLLEAWANAPVHAQLVVSGNGSLARLLVQRLRRSGELPSSWAISLRRYRPEELRLVLEGLGFPEMPDNAAVSELFEITQGRHRFVFSFYSWLRKGEYDSPHPSRAREVTLEDVRGFKTDLDRVLSGSPEDGSPSWDRTFWHDLCNRWDRTTLNCLVALSQSPLVPTDIIEDVIDDLPSLTDDAQRTFDWIEETEILLRLNVFLGGPGRHTAPDLKQDPFWRAIASISRSADFVR